MQSTEILKQRAAESAATPVQAPRHHDTASLAAEHGAALCSLASILLADRAEAEAAVSRLLSRAGRSMPTPDDGTTRRRLSRHLYLNCTWANLVSGYFPALSPWLQQSAGGGVEAIAHLRESSERQRAALALYLHGDHDYWQVAELLSMPAGDVRDLLRSALEELRLDSNAAQPC